MIEYWLQEECPDDQCFACGKKFPADLEIKEGTPQWDGWCSKKCQRENEKTQPRRTKMSKHFCHEDNQGMCYNGCGRVLNQCSARAYFGDAEVDRMLTAGHSKNEENEMYEDDCYEADQRDEEESRFEEHYGSECVNCGQSIYNHDNDVCAE